MSSHAFIDHQFDVVVVGAVARVCAPHWAALKWPEDGMYFQGLPDTLAYGCGAGRHFRRAWQYGR